MWRAGRAIAVLLILGLAAAGFISAQKKISGSSSSVVDSDSSLVVAAASQLSPASQLLQSGADGAPAHSAEAIRVAEAIRAAPTSPDTPAPSTSAQSKSSSIPPCDKSSGMGLSR